jgi:hypothetical protein
MRKGSGDNPSKVGPIIVENTYRWLVLGFSRLHLPQSFVGLESIRDPQLSSGPLALDTLDRFQDRYPAHCVLLDFRLYLPSDCFVGSQFNFFHFLVSCLHLCLANIKFFVAFSK